MKVEVISEKKQRFNGLNYWLDAKAGYYRNAQHKPHSIHRAVWEFHNGPVPKGLVIDHIDRDKSNNQIENLRAVPHSVNNKNVSEKTTAKRRAHVESIREKAKAWHSSEEGRKWHSEAGKESWKKRKPIEKKCAHCGKSYYTLDYSTSARFCSGNCKMRARRRRLKGLPESMPKCEAGKRLE